MCIVLYSTRRTDVAAGAKFNYAPLVPELYAAVLRRLRQPEMDQEVKERAIITLYAVLCIKTALFEYSSPSALSPLASAAPTLSLHRTRTRTQSALLAY